MNRSGAAIGPLLDLPGFDPSRDLLVLVDEVALPLGRFRLRGAGSAGGHNGLKSVEGVLRRQDYARLRIGVGPRPAGLDELSDYVLDDFGKREEAVVRELLPTLTDALDLWLRNGIVSVMNRFTGN